MKERFVIYVDNQKLSDWLHTRKNYSKEVEEILIAKLEGKLVEKSTRDEDRELRTEKTRTEIASMRVRMWKDLKDLGYSLEDLRAMLNGTRKIELPVELGLNKQVTKKILSPDQWDIVYGSLIERYGKRFEGQMKECCVCHDKFSKDETARAHVLGNHSEKVEEVLKEQGIEV